MAAVSTVTQRTQIGFETTEGTAVAANRELPSLTFDLGVAAEHKLDGPAGNKFPTIQTLLKEWTAVKCMGIPTFDELVEVLALALGTPTFTQIGSTTAYTAAFPFASTSAVTPKTGTVEQGAAGSGNAIKAAGVRLSEIGMKVNRNDIAFEGAGYAKTLTTGATLTSSPTAIAQVPITGLDWKVYVDTSAAGLGGTHFADIYSADWKVGGLFNPLWKLNRDATSYSESVDAKVAGEMNFTVDSNSNGLALLTPMRDGSKRFVRLEAVSTTEAGSGEEYSAIFDFAVQVGAPGGFADQDNARVLPYKATIVHDATWGKAFDINIVSKRSAL